MASSSMEVMHPDADRHLIVGTGRKVTFAVCASSMSKGSPVLKHMFRSPDANAAYSWPDPDKTEFELDEDDPDAFRVVLLAIHLRFNDLGERNISDIGTLSSLAVLCDKYDVAHLVKPWVQSWIRQTAESSTPSEDLVDDCTTPWLNVAYVFRVENILKKTIRCIGRNIQFEEIEQNADDPNGKKEYGLLQAHLYSNMIPDIPIAKINRIRTATIHLLLAAVTRKITTYWGDSLQCAGGCHGCDAAILGSLMLGMMKLGLLCPPTVSPDGLAVKSISMPFYGSASVLYKNLLDIQISSCRHAIIGNLRGRSLSSSGTCTCAAFEEKFERSLKNVWESMATKLDNLCNDLLADK